MKLSIRTTRPLTEFEKNEIFAITGFPLVELSTDYKRNNPPYFPLSKSIYPNYEIGKESENEDNWDAEFKDMEKIGKSLETIYKCIVFTYPD